MNQEYITITEINNYIKLMFDNNEYLKKVYLKGEISNFKRHTTGHLYLTLKDDTSRISAIMFRSSASNLTFEPEDGMNVLVEGRISVYPIGGNYQIYIDKMYQDGIGNLYIKFEELKKKLQKEGLFDTTYKKPIPKYPTKIGIVTAPTGAAIKDILSTIKRRFPICETILFPALVQGVSAAGDIANKINMAQEYDLDVLIVGRGGGSIEDLWAFNEEVVARAIFASKIPIISAVGHEIDYTIADFVADLRAPTPTGAAEMAVPTISEVKNIIRTKEIECTNAFINEINDYIHRLKQVKENYVLKNPIVLYEIKMQKLDTIQESIQKNIMRVIDTYNLKLKNYHNHYLLNNPNKFLEPFSLKIKEDMKTLNNQYTYYLEKQDNTLQLWIQTLKLVNPLNILDKGYSLVMKDNKLVKSTKDIKIKDNLQVTLKEGKINVEVKEIL